MSELTWPEFYATRILDLFPSLSPFSRVRLIAKEYPTVEQFLGADGHLWRIPNTGRITIGLIHGAIEAIRPTTPEPIVSGHLSFCPYCGEKLPA